MKILPLFDASLEDKSFFYQFESVKETLQKISPDFISKKIENQVIWTLRGLTLEVILICTKENTLGVGRYMNDVCSRSLVPGKLVNLPFCCSICFKVEGMENSGYALHKICAQLENEEDVQIALETMKHLPQEIQLNIEAVLFLRELFTRPLSLEEKNQLIEKQMGTNLQKNSMEGIHTLLGTHKESEHLAELTQQILSTKKVPSDIFSREIFQELQNFIFSMEEEFTKGRSNEFISHLLAHSYLLRKSFLSKEMHKGPQLEVKFLRPHRNKEDTFFSLGILLAIRLKTPSESIECTAVLESVQAIFPHCKLVEGSKFSHYRAQEGIKYLYIEIFQEAEFNRTILNNLKKKLPFEIDERVFRPVLPIFMPRNEEEVMKHMLLLSKELKYIDDIPQVMLNFYKQSLHTLSFTTIIVALNKGQSLHLPIEGVEKRVMGKLRSRYPKESFVFELTIEKAPFIRKDRSIDLFDARKAASMRLFEIIGPFRDYNGGLILKKSEILLDFKKLARPYTIGSEILLERFFHAISPSYMQGVLQPTTLKQLFLLLLKATDSNCENGFFEAQVHGDTLIIAIGIQDPNLKSRFKPTLDTLNIPSSQLAITHLDQYGVSAMGLILRHFEEEIIPEIRDAFFQWVKEQPRTPALA